MSKQARTSPRGKSAPLIPHKSVQSRNRIRVSLMLLILRGKATTYRNSSNTWSKERRALRKEVKFVRYF